MAPPSRGKKSKRERVEKIEGGVIVNSLKDSFRVMIFMEMKIRMRMEREGDRNDGRDENDHEIKIIK